MKALTIKPEEGQKGRAFAATLLGYMTADRCWDGGTRNGATRPIYLAYATSLAEAGPFTANLRAGRRAIVGDELLSGRSRDGGGSHEPSQQRSAKSDDPFTDDLLF